MHQRDERRDDECRPFADDGGQLIAERLARAGRHHCERVLSREDALHDLILHAAEMVEAEDAFQGFERVGHFTFRLAARAAA